MTTAAAVPSQPMMVKRTIRDPETGNLKTIWINPLTGQQVSNPQYFQQAPSAFGINGMMSPDFLSGRSKEEAEENKITDEDATLESARREDTSTDGGSDVDVGASDPVSRTSDNMFGFNADEPPAILGVIGGPLASIGANLAQNYNNVEAVNAAREAIGLPGLEAAEQVKSTAFGNTEVGQGVVGDITQGNQTYTVTMNGFAPASTGLLGRTDYVAENPVVSVNDVLMAQNTNKSIAEYLADNKALEMSLNYSPEVVDPVYADLVSDTAASNYGMPSNAWSTTVDNTADAFGMSTASARGAAETAAITNENLSLFDDNNDGKISPAEQAAYHEFIGVEDNSFFGQVGNAIGDFTTSIGETFNSFANDVADFFGMGADDDGGYASSSPGGENGESMSATGGPPSSAGQPTGSDGDAGADSGNSNGDTDGVGP